MPLTASERYNAVAQAQPGDRWRQIQSGRLVTILAIDPHGQITLRHENHRVTRKYRDLFAQQYTPELPLNGGALADLTNDRPRISSLMIGTDDALPPRGEDAARIRSRAAADENSTSSSRAAVAQLPVPINQGPFGSVVAVNNPPHGAEGEILRAYAHLFTWSRQAQQAYSAQTCQAWRLDWKAFSRFCLTRRQQPLPALPETVCAFMAWRLELGKKPATIERAVATIVRAHRAAQVANPCESEAVRLAKKAMYRTVPARQRQARGLVWAEIERFLALPVLSLRDQRDRALIATAYDTMCRSEEIVAFDIEDFEWMPDGSGTALIKRAKNDPEGQGAIAYLAPLTVKLLKTWLTAAGLSSGAAFRAIAGKKQLRERLQSDAVRDRVRRFGQWIGLPAQDWAELSGHSSRVGATQDLLALNIELSSVMQAGRWKDARMVTRYGEKILASRGAMARAAKAQGRA